MDDARRRSHARATRAIPLKLVMVSKGGGNAMDVACKEWSDKIKRYAEFEEVVVKTNPKNAKEPSKQLEAEGERVMKHIAETDYVILCDERGEDLTSEELSAAVADAGESNTRVAFVVGGPFGHGPDVVARANRKIRLSSMVMNHQVARFVLLEQIYRTWTILKGEPYHHCSRTAGRGLRLGEVSLLFPRRRSHFETNNAPHSKCGVYGNWSNAANRFTSWVALNARTSSANVAGLHETYTILWNRLTNFVTSGPIPARGGSTNTVFRSNDSKSMFANLSYDFPSSNASASSSEETLASATLSTPLVKKFSFAAFTEAFETSVASTPRNISAITTVKFPLPQYNSRKSSERLESDEGLFSASPAVSNAAAFLAQRNIFTQIPALGCVNPFSSCLYFRVRPSRVSSSRTKSFPRTTWFRTATRAKTPARWNGGRQCRSGARVWVWVLG